MGKRLSVKNRKRRRDQDRAYDEGTTPRRHKVAKERAEKARFKKINRA